MSQDVWTIRTTLNWMVGRFREMGSPTALLDAQLLLSHILNVPKIRLYTDFERPLSAEERAELRGLVKRRLLGEPVAYLLNQKVWHDLDLFVDERVLIPRPETETLLDFVLGYASEASLNPKLIFDFCTGSGCLAIALAKRFPDAKVVGVDISSDALEVARANVERHNVTNVDLLECDVTKEPCYIQLRHYGTPDIIVANPPYISEHEWQQLDIEVRDFEPAISLVAAENGLGVFNAMYNHFLKEGWAGTVSCIAVELAENHPYSFLSSDERVDFEFRSIYSKFPKDVFFAMKDLEQRPRFLCHIKSYEAKRSLDEEVRRDAEVSLKENSSS